MNSGISRSLSSISAIPDLVFRAERAPWLVTPPPRPMERDLTAGKAGTVQKLGVKIYASPFRAAINYLTVKRKMHYQICHDLSQLNKYLLGKQTVKSGWRNG